MQQEWLRERRDLFLKNIVKDFFECLAFFEDLKEHTTKYGVRYDGFDFWVGTEENKGKLWILKDLCHLIWGDDNLQEDDEGVMFDWMVGAIFHEAMKLKENAYMFERYRESFPHKATAILNGNSTKVVKEFFEEMIVEIKRCIKRLEWLFSHAKKHLFQVMKKEKDNALLVRFLLEDISNNGKEKIKSSQETKKLLKSLFPEGLHSAYCLAGESYLEGGWFQEARNAFEKALLLKSDCIDARSGLRLLEKRLKELASFVNREYELLQRNNKQKGLKS